MAEKAVDWHPGTPNPIFINVGGDVIPGTRFLGFRMLTVATPARL
jgi:hypothetical protein